MFLLNGERGTEIRIPQGKNIVHDRTGSGKLSAIFATEGQVGPGGLVETFSVAFAHVVSRRMPGVEEIVQVRIFHRIGPTHFFRLQFAFADVFSEFSDADVQFVTLFSQGVAVLIHDAPPIDYWNGYYLSGYCRLTRFSPVP